MEYEEFKEGILKKRVPKKAKVNNSWGVYDAYKLIRKNKWYDIGRPLKEHEFYSIIRKVNILLAKEITDGNEIHFPCRMGNLELRKIQRGVSIVDGKLRNTYPISWEDTLLLWFTDKEARANKTLVRNDTKFVYHVKYNKHDANYENQCFYEFAVNRFIKKTLKENIDKGAIDTLW